MKRIFITLFIFSIVVGLFAENKVTLLFAGDAMQHERQLVAAKTSDGSYNYSSYFREVKDQISAVDIALVNLETTLPGKGYTGYPLFGSPDSFASALKEVGFDIFLTANNHCADKGKLGIERTIKVLDSLGVRHLGTYTNKAKKDASFPMLIVKNGIRIVLLNYTYDTNGMPVPPPNIANVTSRKQILSDLYLANKMNPDIIIANMHWGDEYKLHYNKKQESLAKFLINNGVRLVIGGHPHVVQPIDIQKKGEKIENIIVYSMGNFVSGMRVVNTDGGMMVKIEISKDENAGVKIDKCDYSLVFVHKPIIDGKAMYQLLPVEKYYNEQGKTILGEEVYKKLEVFRNNAVHAVESLFVKD